MNISSQPSKNPNFKAKFLKSESLKLVADYAVEKGKFERLNQARKNIDIANLTTRLRFDIGEVDGKPFVTFARYDLKPGIIVPKSLEDYKAPKYFIYQSSKKENILKFALERLIKLGNNAPQNKMYKHVVMSK